MRLALRDAGRAGSVIPGALTFPLQGFIMIRSRSLARFIGLCVIAAAVLIANEGRAATIVVTTFADGYNDGDGECSLREAIAAANTINTIDACTPPDLPFIAPNNVVLGPGTYTLSIPGSGGSGGPLLLNNAEMTVVGAGHTATIIDAGPLGDRAMVIGGGGTTTIRDLAIVNAVYSPPSSAADGGGIRINTGSGAVITLERVLLDGNSAVGATDESAYGGAMSIDVDPGETVNIIDSTISNNSALGGAGSIGAGGAAFGGALSIWGWGTVNITGTSILNNVAQGGAGVTSLGTAYGGGISVGAAGQATIVTLTNSTISGNVVAGGGSGLPRRGGGIRGGSSVSLDHCTVASNSAEEGGGIYSTETADDSGPILKDTIVADNVGSLSCPDICNRVQSRGYNLIEDTSGGTLDIAGGGNTGVGNILGADPALLPFANNGGPTLTHALDPGSVALEAGDCFDIGGAPVTTDQRGVPRPLGPGCDIGAYELELSRTPLVDVTAEPAGPNCADGGQRIDVGTDWDGDGVFDANELASTSYVCNGAPGFNALVDVTLEPAGPFCATGGQRIDVGLDDGAGGGVAGDGILQPGEISATEYVCDGVDGLNGTNGIAMLISTNPLAPGPVCPAGGITLVFGLDNGDGGGTAGDGVLQPGEGDFIDNVCDGANGSMGYNSLTVVSPEPPWLGCPAGGTRVNSGVDDGGSGADIPGDGILGSSELDSTFFVCDGTDGADGYASITVMTPEAAGANCTYGGQRIDLGLDDGAPGGTAYDGVLDPAEVDQTSFVCDGAPGADGYSTLITLTGEAAGVNCAAGGQRLEVGLDDGSGGGIASNGILEAGEIDATTYVCDGAAGAAGVTAMITTTPEPAGATCLGGGLRIDVGLDNGDGGGTAGDGVLDAGEIDQTSYVCDGLNGSNGTGYNALIEITTLPVGDANCPDGGQQIDAGLDDGAGGGIPGNGVLEAGEILTTAYACNGANGVDGTDGTDGIDGTTGPAGMAGTDGVDGTDGSGALFVSTELFVGDAMCTWGGQRIDVGVDDGDGGGTAGDGILDDGEIDQTVVVCNGANGDPGQPGGCAILPGRTQTPGAWSALLLVLVIAFRRRRTRQEG